MRLRVPLRGGLIGAAVAAVLLAVTAVRSAAAETSPETTNTTVPVAEPVDTEPVLTPEGQRLLDCFEAATGGDAEGCTVAGDADSSDGDTGCRFRKVTTEGGVGGFLLDCPERVPGVGDLPDGCGYLDGQWCGGGLPTEILERELAACAARPTDAPLADVLASRGWAGSIRSGPGNIPVTVNLRAACEHDITARLAAINAPHGWFNSANVPRSSAGFPMSTYHMYYGAGDWKDFHRRFVGMFLSLSWKAGQVALRIAMWAFDWAVSGHVTEILTGIPTELAELLQERVVRQLRLYEMGLLLLATAVGWKLLRARVADAAGSLVFALLAFTIGWMFLTPSVFDGYYNGARATRQLLAESMTLGVIDDASTPERLDAAAALQIVLDSTVHQPWEQLNFGHALQGDCVDAVKRILVDGIRAESFADLDDLDGCRNATAADIAAGHYPDGSAIITGETLKSFAEVPSGERLFGTFVVVAGQIAVALLVFGVALLALLSEVLLAAAFAALPLAVAGVVWPGGRRVAGAWFALLLRGIVGFAAGMLFLSLVMTVLAAVVGRTQGMPLLERSLAFLLVAYGGHKLRKVFPKAAAQISASLGGKVSAAFSQQGSPGLGQGALVGTAGGLAGGLAAAYLTPGRAMARTAMMAKHGLSGAATRATGLSAAALNAAAATKLARAKENPNPKVTGPGKLLSGLATAAAATRGGQATLAGRQGGGVVAAGTLAMAQSAAATLAGKGKLAGERAATGAGQSFAPSPFAQNLGGGN